MGWCGSCFGNGNVHNNVNGHGLPVLMDQPFLWRSLTVDASRLGPSNPLEIREARLFEREALPSSLAMGAGDILRDALSGEGPPILE